MYWLLSSILFVFSTKKQDIRIYKEMLNKLHVAIYNKGCSASSRILILIRDAIEKYEEKHGKIEL